MDRETLGGVSDGDVELVQKVARFVGPRKVIELEALATAVWINRQLEVCGTEATLQELLRLKPHLDRGVATKGIEDSEKLLASAFVP